MNDESISTAVLEPWANAWQSQTKSGEILHLVRLSAIVQWLMAAKRKYFKHAILEMCQSLSGFKGLRMYLDYGNGDARAVSEWDYFGLREVKYRHEYYLTPLPDGVTGGISAALYYMEKVWGEGRRLGPRKNKEEWLGLLYYENDIDGNFDPRDAYTGEEKPEMLLSIPAEQAATIFGTVADVVPLHAVTNADEEPANWSQLVAFRKKYSRDTWKQEHKEILLKEFNRRSALPGAKFVAEDMAQELGIKVDRLNKVKRSVHELGMREKQRKTA